MRRALLILGLITLAAVWLTALPQLARQAFWAHMTMHMGVVAVAAPLLALGVGGGRLDPVRSAPWLFAPIPASILELIVVWTWHAPAPHHGIPSQRISACVACHGPGSLSRNPVYPELAGQYADYLVLQLEIFKQNVRGGTAYAHLMRQVASGLNAEQMRDVARYYASLTSASDARARTSP